MWPVGGWMEGLSFISGGDATGCGAGPLLSISIQAVREMEAVSHQSCNRWAASCFFLPAAAPLRGAQRRDGDGPGQQTRWCLRQGLGTGRRWPARGAVDAWQPIMQFQTGFCHLLRPRLHRPDHSAFSGQSLGSPWAFPQPAPEQPLRCPPSSTNPSTWGP